MFRAVLLLVALPLCALAQSSVPPDVESVVSGGFWESGSDRGRYRVIVVNSGWEHVTSRVYVEWVREPKSEGSEVEVVASVEPDLPFGNGVASLGASLTPAGKGKARVVVTGVVSVDPTKKVRAVFIATEPGVVRR